MIYCDLYLGSMSDKQLYDDWLVYSKALLISGEKNKTQMLLSND